MHDLERRLVDLSPREEERGRGSTMMYNKQVVVVGLEGARICTESQYSFGGQ